MTVCLAQGSLAVSPFSPQCQRRGSPQPSSARTLINSSRRAVHVRFASGSQGLLALTPSQFSCARRHTRTMHARTQAHTRARTHSHTHTYPHVRTHTVYMYTRMHVHTQCSHVCTQCTCTRTHAHTHSSIFTSLPPTFSPTIQRPFTYS